MERIIKGDPNHGLYFILKGGMTAWCDPPVVNFTNGMLWEIKARVSTEEKFGSIALKIM